MPEFILDLGTLESELSFKSLDSFTQGYIEAMFFTSTGTGDDTENNLEDANVSELAPDTLARIVRDCEAFQTPNSELLEYVYELWDGYDSEKAGRDFWFSRNGHGAGFFDRKLGKTGDMLQEAARRRGSVDLYRGDDGKLYLA